MKLSFEPFRALRPLPVVALALALPLAMTSCSSGGSSGGGGGNNTFKGTVEGATGIAVENATVYLVSAFDVPTTPITAAGVLARTTEAFDEPLEDVIAAMGPMLQSELTNANGEFSFKTIDDGRYYIFVGPDAADTEHIPGGSKSRVSYDADELRGEKFDIEMSSSPTAAATYIGMSVCLACHPSYETEETLAHRLGFRVPGVSSPLQDTSEHPEIDNGLAFFLEGNVYSDGTPVYHYDFDPTRGFDKFKTSLTDPTPDGGVIYAILWTWKDMASGQHKITIENVGNAGDPDNFAERDVELTYGGAVFKQRYMIKWPGLNGLYPVLQFQTFGDDARWDRTRQVFRDYHLDFYWDDGGTPADPSNDLIKTPSITRNIQRNCMGCHAADYQQFTDPVTMEVLCTTLEDPNGEYDIDGNGQINDLNTGCENCHGPGSDHVADGTGRYIVSPEYMSPEREVMICGRCHDRQVGAGTVQNDHPLNALDEWPLPGISRQEYLTNYTTRPGPAAGSFWTDFEHSKSHHQHSPDLIKSLHYRNPYELVTCADCHNMHGGTGYKFGLIEDPKAPDTELCMRCHEGFLPPTDEHTQALLGVTHGAAIATCVSCHMPKTAKTGSGSYGYLLAPPTGTSTDSSLTYFENDISSHVFDVPRKGNPGVQGVVPEKAMPIPYTNSCGTCHDPSQLQFF